MAAGALTLSRESDTRTIPDDPPTLPNPSRGDVYRKAFHKWNVYRKVWPMTAPRKPRRRTVTAPAGTAIGYVRVSSEEQAVSGLGLEAQRAAIRAQAEALGVTVVGWESDEAVSGTVAPVDRPGLTAALDDMAEGKAERLIVAKLDRLGRSTLDVLNLDALARSEGWGLVLCDVPGLDTATPEGRMLLTQLASFAQFERDRIAQRTREALAVKKAQGVRLGRPSVLPREVVARIVSEREQGRTLRQIAEGLTADGIRTARGRDRWGTSGVQAVLNGQDAATLRADA